MPVGQKYRGGGVAGAGQGNRSRASATVGACLGGCLFPGYVVPVWFLCARVLLVSVCVNACMFFLTRVTFCATVFALYMCVRVAIMIWWLGM